MNMYEQVLPDRLLPHSSHILDMDLEQLYHYHHHDSLSSVLMPGHRFFAEYGGDWIAGWLGGRYNTTPFKLMMGCTREEIDHWFHIVNGLRMNPNPRICILLSGCHVTVSSIALCRTIDGMLLLIFLKIIPKSYLFSSKTRHLN